MAETKGIVDKAVEAGANVFKAPAERKSHHSKAEQGRRRQRRATGAKRSLADGLTLTWGLGGSIVARVDGPVGRCMQVQAPYAGKQLDLIIRDSEFLYGWLSPLFGSRHVVPLFHVFLPPLLIWMMERQPGMDEIFAPVLQEMIRPAVTYRAKEAAKLREVMEEIVGGGAGEEPDAELVKALQFIAGAPEEDHSHPEPSDDGQAEVPEGFGLPATEGPPPGYGPFQPPG